MTTTYTPYREPVRVTLTRALTIAVILGAIIAGTAGGLRRWPAATLVALWPALGGHFVELWYLNWLRPRLSPNRVTQVTARLLTWFAGGVLCGIAMGFTARAIGTAPSAQWLNWWISGLGFVALELIVHLVMFVRGIPSFYDRRG
jgi:hypothetical protein